MIKIICVGKVKEQYLSDLISDYIKRIKKYHKLEIIELKDLNNPSLDGVNILKNIDSKDYVISLTPVSKQMDSIEFANMIDNLFVHYSTITFVIGGSDGLSKEVLDKSNLCLSCSLMTFPHILFRAMLLEQIYRSFKINNNETYHK